MKTSSFVIAAAAFALPTAGFAQATRVPTPTSSTAKAGKIETPRPMPAEKVGRHAKQAAAKKKGPATRLGKR